MLGRCSGHAPLLVVAGVAEGLADLHLLLLLLFFVELDGNRPDGYFLVYVFHRFLYNFIIYILSISVDVWVTLGTGLIPTPFLPSIKGEKMIKVIIISH